MTIEKKFNAFSLMRLVPAESLPHLPQWMNVRFAVNQGLAIDDLRGAGIYSIFFKGQLIYIGKFLGKRNSPCDGNVLESRWVKHIGTLTLRSKMTSFSSRSLYKILNESHVLNKDFKNSDAEKLTRDRGNLSTYNRFKFALKNWSIFQNMQDSDLNDFKFLYSRLDLKTTSSMSTFEIRKKVSLAENVLVEQFKPCCNAVVDSKDSSTESVSEQRFFEMAKRYLNSSDVEKKNDLKVHEDAEDVSVSSIFCDVIESAPSWAGKLYGDLINEFKDDMDIEIHYKKVNVAQMRIRSLYSILPNGRNIATIHWKPRKKAFHCVVYAHTQVCNSNGFNAFDTAEHEPLNSYFEFTDAHKSEKLIEIIRQSISADQPQS